MDGEALRARRTALKMVDRRAYSARELVQRLEKRDHETADAETAVRDLERAGIVNDRTLGESVVRAELSRSPAGRVLLEMKLVKRGIDRVLAGEVVAEALGERASDEDADEVARRHMKSFAPSLGREAVRRRLYGKLARRGFSPEVARGAVERATEGLGVEE